MKRRILSMLVIAFALVFSLGVLAACRKDPTLQSGEEAGEYYHDNGSTEDTLTLADGKYTLKLDGSETSGVYTLNGESLKLGDLTGSYLQTTIELSYNGESYLFYKKIEYTVTFKGAAESSVKVVNGKTVAKPDDPQKDGEVFIGWYTEDGYTNFYAFETPVTGDLTLYGRFVTPIEPEFTVTFEAGEGTCATATAETVGHKLYRLPEAEWTGHTFLGWWVSQYGDGTKLSYRYEEQLISEPVTLYAVWEDETPAVSVGADKITWTGRGSTFQITVKKDGVSVHTDTATGNEYTKYTFTDAGEYVVEVKNGENVGTAYYKHKALARVSAFEVEGNTLLFNEIPDAASYTLSYVCGTPVHNHQVTIAKDTRSYDFGACEMPEGGFVFTVTAQADGYLPSVATYTCARKLAQVTDLAIANGVATWGAVADAAYFEVTVTSGDEVKTLTVPANYRRVDLKQYGFSGSVTVAVKAVARGWAASDVAEKTETLAATLEVPQNIALNGNVLSWSAVDGATWYSVKIGGTEHRVENATSYTVENQTADFTVTVTAKGADNATSLESEALTVKVGAIGNLAYANGVLSWDPVFGVSAYTVQVGKDGTQETVTGATSKAVVFDAKGDIELTVTCTADGKALTGSVTVKVYGMTFVDKAEGLKPETRTNAYYQAGDEIAFPAPAAPEGYLFGGWYTEENGQGTGWFVPEGIGFVSTPIKYFEGDADVTLYALWVQKTWKFTLDVGDYGKPLESAEVTVDYLQETFELPVPESSDPRYAFYGWYDGSNHYTANKITDQYGKNLARFTNLANLKLYAMWDEVFLFTERNEGKEYSVAKSANSNNLNNFVEITIPATYLGKPVGTIDDFSSCSTLKVINIPTSVKIISLGTDSAAFRYCSSLEKIHIYGTPAEGETAYWADDDGVLYHFNSEADGGRVELALYPANHGVASYAVPASVTFPDGVERYVDTLPTGAFYSISSASSSVRLSKLELPATVSLIERNAFYSSSVIKEVAFTDDGAGTEGEAAQLDIRSGAFGSSGITKITLPQVLTEASYAALRSISTLQTIEVTGTGTYMSVEGLLVKTDSSELLVYPKGKGTAEFTVPALIAAIGADAFYGNETLRSVVIPAHVTRIGVEAFMGCTSLASVTFGGNEASQDLTIESYAFASLPLLESITLPANLAELGSYAFASCAALRTVELTTAGEGRTEVDYHAGAFLNAGNIGYVMTVKLGANVPELDITAIFGSRVQTVEVDEANPNYVSEEAGVIYNKDYTSLIFFPANWSGPYTIPAKVTKLAANMFADRLGLTGIVIHSGVTEIGARAFQNCTGLASVTFTGTFDELTIGDQAFMNCGRLASISLPDALTSIGDQAFANCSALEAIEIPAAVETLGAAGETFRVFDGCTNLVTVTVATENTHYKADPVNGLLFSLRSAKTEESGELHLVEDALLYSFMGKQSDGSVTEEVTVSGYIRSVKNGAFVDNPYITKITFTDIIKTWDAEGTEIGVVTFPASGTTAVISRCPKLTEVVFPNGMETFTGGIFNPSSNPYQYTAIAKITIPGSVQTINGGAFKWKIFPDLTEIVFEESDTPLTIGSTGYAFEGLTALRTLRLPKRIYAIKTSAFENMMGLEEVIFDEEGAMDGFTLGSRAFFNCTSLRSVNLPEQLKKIEANTFSGTTSLKELVLPDGVTEIGSTAFGSTMVSGGRNVLSGLTSITLPSSLTTIAASAFKQAYNLTGEIVIPAGVTTLGSSAFQQTAITSVVFGDAEHDSALTTISTYAFNGCPNLASVTFHGFANDVTIANNAFQDCPKLSSIALPERLKSIGNAAFSGCTALSEVTFGTNEEHKSSLGTGVTGSAAIGNQAFAYTAISSVELPESDFNYSLGTRVFDGCQSLAEITIPACVTSVTSSFAGCAPETITVSGDNLTEDEAKTELFGGNGSLLVVYREKTGTYTFSQDPAEIGAYAFAGQTEITSVTIPASVTTIGEGAFQNCVSLSSFNIEQGSALVSLGAGVFKNCTSLVDVDFTNASRLTTLTNGTSTGGLFAGCSSLRKVTFGAGIETIGTYLFVGSAVEEVDLTASTKVTALGNYMFQNCTNFKKIDLPVSLTTLGNYTFDGCTSFAGDNGVLDLSGVAGLTEIMYSAAATVGSGANTFRNCTALEKVILPARFTRLGGGVFQNCTSLTEVTGPDGAPLNYTFIGSYAFENTAITSFEFGTGLTNSTIGAVFRNCASLSDVTFAEGCALTALPTNLFQNCTALERIDLTPLTDLKTLNNYLFQNCSALEEVVLGEGVTTLGTYVFEGCTSLTDFDFTRFTAIGNYAFRNSGIKNVEIPSTVKTLGTYVFAGCGQLETVTFAEGFGSAAGTSVGVHTFNGSSIQSLDLSGARLESLPNNMCYNCASLTDVKLPRTLLSLGTYTFYGCTSLEEIDFSNTLVTRLTAFNATTKLSKDVETDTSTDSHLFDGCISLRDVKITEGLGQIGGYTFYRCESLTSFDFSTIEKIGASAFAGSGLTSIEFSDRLTYLYSATSGSAFADVKAATVSVKGDNPYFSVREGGLLVTNGGEIVLSAGNVTAVGGTLDLSNSGLTLGAYGLSGVTGITTVKLPATLTKIPDYAFADSSITSIDLPESVTEIGKYAFYGSKLTSIDLKNVRRLGSYAFAYTDLASIDVPAAVTSISTYAFAGSKIASAKFNGAFQVVDDSSLIVGPWYLFADCEQLASVTLPEGLTAIGGYTFSNTPKLKSLTVPESVTRLYNSAFENTSFTSIVLPGVEIIGTNIFKNNTALRAATFSKPFISLSEVNGPTLDGDNATGGWSTFDGCTALAEVRVAEGQTRIGSSMFKGATALKNFTIPSSVFYIGTSAFEGSGITSIKIPEGITLIGESAFANCADLKTVEMSGALPISSKMFANSTAISTITIPATVKSIIATAFSGWTANQTIRFETTRFETAALFGLDWSIGLAAKVEYATSVRA